MSGKYDGLDRHSLSAIIVEKIRDAILSGKYSVGDALTETRLAEELGVSRTPVREALHQLELEDLVESAPNRGAIVKGLSKQDISDIFTIRMLLEGQAAFWSCERATSAETDRLREIVELMDMYTRRSDLTQLARLDTEFHDLLYSSCKSRVLRRTLSSLHHNSTFARLGNYHVPSRPKESLEEHRAICAAIEARDSALASKLISDHIASAYKTARFIAESE